MSQLSAPESLTPVLKSIPGWENLDRREQTVVENSTREIHKALVGLGRSRLAIGEHLIAVQTKLEPHRMFGRFLRAANLKRSWAYEQMIAYQNASKWLPAPVLEAAMMRNMPMLGPREDKPLGVYTNAVKRIPPPTTNDHRKIQEYLDTVEESRRRGESRTARIDEVQSDPETLLKETYRFAMSRINKLPSRGKGRRTFVDSLVGMLLSEIGVASAIPFHPEAIPDGFRAVVGRPQTTAAA